MKVKLNELYDIGSSKRVFQSEWRESGVPFYRAREIAKLSEDGFVDNELFIDEELYSEYVEKYGKPESGDVMVTGVGTLGVCYVVKPKDRFYFKDGNILWFRQKAKDKILPEYLVKAFDSKEVKDFINKNSSGTTVGTFTIQTAKMMEISLPSLDEQKEIIDKVTRTELIIKQRKQELQLLDNLIKARFVEMFGDPIRNTQNRPTTEFINVVRMQRGFDLPVQDRQQDGRIPVYGSNGALDHHNVAKIQGGGVITGRSGTIGKVFYTEGDYWPLNTSLFSVDTHGNNVIYLAYLLYLFNLTRFVEGTGVPTLNRNMFHNKQIINVPIEEQNQFADFVHQVDKSKVVVQKALDETQLLFDSLMQKYFG